MPNKTNPEQGTSNNGEPQIIDHDATRAFFGDVIADNGDDNSWFANTEDFVRLDLGRGRWIEIKSELTFLEEEKLVAVGVTGMRQERGPEGDEGPAVNEFKLALELFNLAKLKMWLIGWNARDRYDRPIACTAAEIDRLKPSVAKEMLDRIEEYQNEQEARKNQAALPAPSARS